MSKLRAPQIDTGIGPNQIVGLDGSGNIPAETTGLLLASKTSDESVTSAALQDDDELIVTIPGPGFYIINLYMLSDGPGAGVALDFKFDYTDTISSSVLSLSSSPITGGPGIDGSPYSTPTTGLGVFDASLWVGSATFLNSGLLKLQWAQQVADAIATTIFAGSYLSLQKV